MMKNSTGIILAGLFMVQGLVMADTATAKNIQVCFTPQDQCTNQVVNAIDHANKSIDLQSFEFTSIEVANALEKAKKRGVEVQVVLDKENVFNSKSVRAQLKRNAIPYLIDSQPDAAYGNVMIIDNKQVVTGTASFINTKKIKVADDILFIKDAPEIVSQYMNNFAERKKVSDTEKVFCKHSAQCKFSQAAGSAKKAASDVWNGTKNFWKKHVGGE